MTDNYDLDPHEHDDHVEDDAHQSKAEAWPDDQPPVDDFADPGAEETATSSEEMGTHQEEIMDPEPRKSSALLPIIAGVGGLLFLGAILYWQFGRSPPTPPSLPSPPPLQMVQATVARSAAPATSEANTAGKELAPELAVPVKQAASPSPSAADVAPKTSLTVAANSAAAMPTPPLPVAPMPSGVANASPPSAPVILSPPSTSTASNAGSLETRVAALSIRMDELKKELDQATQQLGQMNVALSSPSFGNGNVAAEDRLAKIEQQIRQMERKAASSAPAMALSDSPSAEPETIAASRTPVVSKHTRKIRTSKTSRYAARPVAINWVLRAATPTEAWVAKNESTAELRHIRVGDELPGIGHINAIHQNGDSWVIEGSAGTIH